MNQILLFTKYIEPNVSNEEIRYRLLKVLYDYHYNVEPDTLVETENILKVGLENEERNILDANIVYLKKGYYVEGVGHQPGSAVPLSMKIQSSGIEFVEERNQEYREAHDDLRYKILSNLYEFQFSGNAGKFTSTVSVADNIADSEEEKHQVLVEILYLVDRGYLNPAVETSGVFYPRGIFIDNYGIDVIDGIIDQSIEKLETAEIDKDDKAKILEIKSTTDKKTRIEKFGELFPKPSEVTKPIIVETIKQVIIQAFSGGFSFGE